MLLNIGTFGMMKIFKEFEIWLEIVSQPQVLYTYGYYDFYFVGFEKVWDMIFALVETPKVA
jgi:hypothetical protein